MVSKKEALENSKSLIISQFEQAVEKGNVKDKDNNIVKNIVGKDVFAEQTRYGEPKLVVSANGRKFSTIVGTENTIACATPLDEEGNDITKKVMNNEEFPINDWEFDDEKCINSFSSATELDEWEWDEEE